MRNLRGLRRSTWWTVCSATLFLGASLAAQDTPSGDAKPQRRARPDDPEVPHYALGKFVWPEFSPGAVERGEADEPDIANLGADWSYEMELRLTVDRTEFRQAERIRILCYATNVSGANHIWLPPFHPLDRYLQARVRVFDSKGKLRPMTEFYKHEGRERVPLGGGAGAMVSGCSLNPGVSFRTDLVPNLIYDMTQPGDYWILVEIPLASSFPHHAGHEGKLFFLRAQPMKVRVNAEVLDLNDMPRMIKVPPEKPR